MVKSYQWGGWGGWVAHVIIVSPQSQLDLDFDLDCSGLPLAQKLFLLKASLSLFGEGEYNLNSLKEISVTYSFLGLGKDTRKCQSVETFDDCKTRLYINNIKENCGCLPVSIGLSEEVHFEVLKCHIFIYFRICFA